MMETKTLSELAKKVEESRKEFFEEVDKQLCVALNVYKKRDRKKVIKALFEVGNLDTNLKKEAIVRYIVLKIFGIIGIGGKEISSKKSEGITILLENLIRSRFGTGFGVLPQYNAKEDELARLILDLYKHGYKKHGKKISAEEFAKNPSNLVKVIWEILYQQAPVV